MCFLVYLLMYLSVVLYPKAGHLAIGECVSVLLKWMFGDTIL